jgi:hypothetical protein
MTVRDKIEELRRRRPILSEEEQSAQIEANKRRHAVKYLTDAFETLATGTGDVRSRLLLASMSFVNTQREDFPIEKQRLWDEVMKTIERFEPYFETRSGAFLNSPKNATWGMRNITAHRAAKNIVELYWSVTKNRRYE